MRTLKVATMIGLAFAMPAFAQTGSPVSGEWTVDLRPDPNAPAYLKPMVIAVGSDGSITGTFYDHAIDKGRASAVSGRACFAFRTFDDSGAYHTSGCLVGDQIEGQTWSEGRNFLLAWTAVRRGVSR
ncbi:hypothetical protein [Brevundimonas variabilis]|uniref:DUF2147 domain-containing protein n=1 Tax=Brevundimonas variabilis TaxID=74312 RepID=A0A7W9CIV6_9CAUL|nr:hypothetical protein [Brevundimonas variabilis]MBB5746284.1 hypothetical protein [Brevundimonas variabilis]